MRGVVIAPRWRKVVRDVLGRPGRSLLAVVAIAAGVFEVGAMLYKYAVLQPVLTTMYGKTRPASATFVVDAVDDDLVASVRRVPGVAEAEARPVVLARVRIGDDEWVPALLYVVRDYRDLRIDTFEPEAGAWPPGDGEVLLERTALPVAKTTVGDSLSLSLAGGDEAVVRVAGTVHAAGLAPAWMEHMVPGFVGWNSSLRGAENGESAQLRIVVGDHPLDEGYVREISDSVQAMLVRQGREVTRVIVPVPGRHPHADQMEAFLFLLLSFGILSFLLSAVLVASMIHALMSEQVREIGIMKAIGATRRQIAGMYLGQVGLLSSVALALGIPLGILVGDAYAQFAAGILNADVTGSPFPFAVVAAVAAIGVVVPVLVALVPIRRAARLTVYEALSDDRGARPFATHRTDRWMSGLAWLPRPLALSLRTTFARRGRLALTIGMLALGGAAFMAALNVSGAWTRAVDSDFRGRRYDLTASLAAPTPTTTIDSLLATVPEVTRGEYWPSASPYLIGASGVPGSTVALVGPDAATGLLDLPLLAGRWLLPGDSTGAVINQAVVAANPTLVLGGVVPVRFEGRTSSFPIVGIVKELAPMAVIYAPPSAVRALTGRPAGVARTVRIVTRGHDDASQRAAAQALERAFAARGIEVSGMQRMQETKQSILDHLVIIIAILTMATVVVVFVGGLGLTSMLTLNVLQRTREIGVLGAIGATPRTIAGHVWFEGVAIGALSWVAAVVLAVPVSYLLETVCGSIFFKAPLAFYLSPGAAGIWLALVLVLASISSFYPARRAARLTVREALSHA